MIRREIESTDRLIDALVYELYGLTEEEIKMVEGGKYLVGGEGVKLPPGGARRLHFWRILPASKSAPGTSIGGGGDGAFDCASGLPHVEVPGGV